ncbi:methyl-accepting chemotaxis protein [Castellaniella caeni]
MKNFKISTRLAGAFAFLLLLALILSAIGIWNARKSQAISQEIVARQQINQIMTEWVRAVDVRANQVIGYILVSDPDVLDHLKKGIDTNTKDIADYTERARALIKTKESLALYDDIMAQRKQYVDAMNTAIQALDKHQSVLAIEIVRDKLPVIGTDYIASIDKLRDFQQAGTDRAQDLLAHDAQLSENILIIATLLAFILGPLFAWRVMRAITRPLANAVSIAESIANNDLSHHIHSDANDEIGMLCHALERMTQNLHQAVSKVRGGADSIATAASQISAGNLDLSSRTEQQASSLAQTAATMEEITATVRQNADNTQQANTLAAAAAKTAVSGGSLVGHLVDTMGEINGKSQQVADIIGVIDSIAFQTNILALNAAVEAARAGEQGRGFAVVASEVRALAQRSAGAAKEIKALIDSSVEATTKGNEQAAHAGATMQEIVDSINRVTDIMGEISAANREQTTGIEEINTAITQMDDVTRQNASLVEESAAAATSLQSQADNLAQLVATFNLGTAATDAAGTGARPAGARAGQATGAGTRAGAAGGSQAGAQAAGSRAPRLPAAAPEKVVSPAPQRPRRTEPKAAEPSSTRSALRAPGRPAPATVDTEEWTEF